MITIPQSYMRAGMIVGFAIGGIIVEHLAIFAYNLAKPAVMRLYDDAVKSSRPFTVTPRRKAKRRPIDKATINGHAKKPKVAPVPTAAE